MRLAIPSRSGWRWQYAITLAACAGMLLPAPMLHATELHPPRIAASSNPTVAPVSATSRVSQAPPAMLDVALDGHGTLHGVVVDAQGAPRVNAGVVVYRGGHQVAHAAADAQGRFAVDGLRGGVYQIAAGERTDLYRVWAAGTAPPVARDGVMIVAQGDAVRGQWHLPDVSTSDFVLVGAVIAAAIAIPIAVHNSRKARPPAS